MTLPEITDFLKNYKGKPLTFMEVCGTHTASITENGIPSLISENIRLVSGPGCPVCVTVASYIDKLVELSKTPGTCVVTFGDMLRVRGTERSLRDVGAEGGRVQMVYSPFEILELAKKEQETTFVFAAVGFETTTPIYAMLLEEAEEQGLHNIRLLTALKTMPKVVERVCEEQNEISGFHGTSGFHGIDGFLAPGHVCVITGSEAFRPLAERFGLPFVVAGFEGEELLSAIYALVKLEGKGTVENLYRNAVTEEGNVTAQKKVSEYFEPCDAAWRGMGMIPGSGMRLKEKWKKYDAGSEGLVEDKEDRDGCRCAEVITGKCSPCDCPLHGTVCTPENPVGACMVSMEGACYHYYINGLGSDFFVYKD